MKKGLSKTQVLTPNTLKSGCLKRHHGSQEPKPSRKGQANALVLTRSAQFSLYSSSLKSRPRNKGGLAQLVERLLCKQNVNGSNPLTSTTQVT